MPRKPASRKSTARSKTRKVWDDPKRAQELGREKKTLDLDRRRRCTRSTDGLRDAGELFEMARGEERRRHAAIASRPTSATLAKQVADLEFRRMFTNPMDPNNCFIDIQAGSGGTEAQDWAVDARAHVPALLRAQGLQASKLLEESDGEVAGIKSATLKVSGDYAYGILRTETGVHRLVRKSPFDSNARRHTSFASVFVYPEVDESIEVEINPADLRIDTYRASGAGGQHINKTDSAVRITHAADRHRRADARTTARSTATAPRRWRC